MSYGRGKNVHIFTSRDFAEFSIFIWRSRQELQTGSHGELSRDCGHVRGKTGYRPAADGTLSSADAVSESVLRCPAGQSCRTDGLGREALRSRFAFSCTCTTLGGRGWQWRACGKRPALAKSAGMCSTAWKPSRLQQMTRCKLFARRFPVSDFFMTTRLRNRLYDIITFFLSKTIPDFL